MPFAYYDRLSRAQQRIYRESDAVATLPLSGAAALRPAVSRLGEALATGNRLETERATQQFLSGMVSDLGVAPLKVEVLAARPARRGGELHGLYSRPGRGRPARLTVWMRTASKKNVVAFRTFLRTLLHELAHHLDYERLGLVDSFHTEGFYKRESSLFHQLWGHNGSGGDRQSSEVAESLLLMR